MAEGYRNVSREAAEAAEQPSPRPRPIFRPLFSSPAQKALIEAVVAEYRPPERPKSVAEILLHCHAIAVLSGLIPNDGSVVVKDMRLRRAGEVVL